MNYLTPLNFPKADLKLSRDKSGSVFVNCLIRKKKLLLTPEEWVRQHVLSFLIEHCDYPKSLICSEYGLKVNGMVKRADIVVVNQMGKTGLIVECKAPEVKLTQKTLTQIANYNKSLGANFLMISNGLASYIIEIKQELNELSFREGLPRYQEL